MDTTTLLMITGIVADLSGAWGSIVQRWIGPVVIIIIGVQAIQFLVKGQMRPFIGVLAMGLLVAVVIYAGPAIFGQGSALVHSGGEIAKQVN